MVDETDSYIMHVLSTLVVLVPFLTCWALIVTFSKELTCGIVIVILVHRLTLFLWGTGEQGTTRQPTEIITVVTPEEWDTVYHYNAVKTCVSRVKLLGLDCEWLPYNDGEKETTVALLQLSTYDGLCILIRLKLLSQIPSTLRDLLGDKSILKLGVSVCEDGDKLHRHFGIKVKGCLDLRHALKKVKGYYKCKSWGLYGLSECILGYKMLKDPKIRCGNWEARELSDAQKLYAAMDALVGLDIYIKLVVTQIIGRIPTSHDLYLYCLQKEFNTTSLRLQKGIVDRVYKFRRNLKIKFPQRTAVQSTEKVNQGQVMRKTYQKEDDRKSGACQKDDEDSIICYCSQEIKQFVERDFGGKTIKVCKNCDYYFDKEDEEALNVQLQ